MSEFKAACQHMEFNPFGLPTGGLMKNVYPELGRRPVFHTLPEIYKKAVDGDTGELIYENWTTGDHQLLLRYVILFIDKNSPVYKESDLEMRTRMICQELRIKKGSPTKLEIDHHSELLTDMMHEYFRFHNNYMYEEWLTQKIFLHNLTNYMRKPPDIANLDRDMASRAKIRKDIEPLRDAVLLLEAELFQDPKVLELVMRKATLNDIEMVAEEYAEDRHYS